MAKYTEKLAEKIVSLIEEDTFSITEICKHLKITRKSFYEWRDKKPEFRKAIEAAIESRDETLAITARRSLKKKLEGYTLTEIRTTYVPDKENIRQVGAEACPCPFIFGRPQGIAPTVAKTICRRYDI